LVPWLEVEEVEEAAAFDVVCNAEFCALAADPELAEAVGEEELEELIHRRNLKSSRMSYQSRRRRRMH